MGANDKVRGKTDITTTDGLTEIGILLYPRAQMSAVLGLTDLFAVANRLSAEHEGANPRELRISHWQSRDSKTLELGRTFDTHQQPPQKLVGLILPPNLDTDPQAGAIPRLQEWVGAQHASGCIVCSVCGGAFLLAKTGLLDGRSATTHWSFSETLAERFPKIRVDTEKLIIDDGDIITAGGVMAWVDLGLNLIERFLSPTVMLATARFFLVDAAGREQRFYSSFAPQLVHGHSPVLRVQHWLQQHITESPSIDVMAARANLVKRTFLRRFHKATGMTPTRYLQHLRVGKARESLEFSMLSINEIAWMTGYGDTGSF